MVAAVSATLAVAFVSWHFYESLFLKLKHRFEGPTASIPPGEEFEIQSAPSELIGTAGAGAVMAAKERTAA